MLHVPTGNTNKNATYCITVELKIIVVYVFIYV